MPVYNGKKLAQEKLLDIAAYCIHASLKAPQITGRVELDFEVVTAEDLGPIIDAFGLLGSVAGFHAISLMSYTKALASGEPPVLLLIGGKKLRKSELNWNCGACGFKTCGEFNKYSKKVEPDVLCEANGPLCQWKVVDYGMACDWACAQAWHHNITNRVEVASGWAAKAIGYMPECDVIRGLPLGPMKDMFWYSREVCNDLMPYEIWKDVVQMQYPTHWGAFPGHGHPFIKSGQKWWETEKERSLAPRDREAFEQTKVATREGIQALREKVQIAKKERE